MGHFDPFPPRGLNGRCPFGQPTSAGSEREREGCVRHGHRPDQQPVVAVSITV